MILQESAPSPGTRPPHYREGWSLCWLLCPKGHRLSCLHPRAALGPGMSHLCELRPDTAFFSKAWAEVALGSLSRERGRQLSPGPPVPPAHRGHPGSVFPQKRLGFLHVAPQVSAPRPPDSSSYTCLNIQAWGQRSFWKEQELTRSIHN